MLVRRVVLGAMMLCLAAVVRADGLEYRYEVGAMVGSSTYYGDANYSSPLNNFGIMGGALFRYNINPRMAVKADFAVARISGTTAGGDNVFPGGEAVLPALCMSLGRSMSVTSLLMVTAWGTSSRAGWHLMLLPDWGLHTLRRLQSTCLHPISL